MPTPTGVHPLHSHTVTTVTYILLHAPACTHMLTGCHTFKTLLIPQLLPTLLPWQRTASPQTSLLVRFATNGDKSRQTSTPDHSISRSHPRFPDHHLHSLMSAFPAVFTSPSPTMLRIPPGSQGSQGFPPVTSRRVPVHSQPPFIF